MEGFHGYPQSSLPSVLPIALPLPLPLSHSVCLFYSIPLSSAFGINVKWLINTTVCAAVPNVHHGWSICQDSPVQSHTHKDTQRHTFSKKKSRCDVFGYCHPPSLNIISLLTGIVGVLNAHGSFSDHFPAAITEKHSFVSRLFTC